MIAKFGDSIAGVRKETAENELNGAANKRQLVSLVDIIKKSLTAREMLLFRDKEEGRAYRIAKCILIAVPAYEAYMREHAISAQQARQMRAAGCMTLRYWLMHVHRTLAQYVRGDPSQANEKKLLNNTLDVDYVLTASYFEGLLSADIGARDGCDDLESMLGLAKKYSR